MSFCPFSIAITSLGEERELTLVLFVRLFGLCLFRFVGFLFLLGSGFEISHKLSLEIICMKRQSQNSAENKKNTSKCRPLKLIMIQGYILIS